MTKYTRKDIEALNKIDYKSLDQSDVDGVKGDLLLQIATDIGKLPAEAFEKGGHELTFQYFIQ